MQTLMGLLLCSTVLAAKTKPVFIEKGGLIVMEAESTSSSLRKWKKKTDVTDFQGECHLEFTGNTITNGPPTSPLKYHFRVQKSGQYTLILRARKRLESKRHDLSNDCYVKLEGDFETGGKAPLKILRKDTKMFGGEADRWGWAIRLDANHKKYPAEYSFKKEEEYTLTISGRSKNFNLDRIVFVHESKKLQEIQKKNPPESKIDQGEPAPRVVRSLTNQEGKTITAELISLTHETLTILLRGKRMTIQLHQLIEDDQRFVRAWAEDQ